MTRSTKSWVLSEFKSLLHNDKRLDKRFVKVARDALENPAAPINQASGDWAASKAAYRFYNNPKVDKAEIAKVHQKKTLERMENHKVILAIQDTTLLDFSTHTKLRGKGPIGTRMQDITGFIMHSTLAVTTAGLPLGLITHSLWARDQIKENRNDVKEGDKESIKWINALKTTCEVVPPNVEIIHICDREADFFEFLEVIESLEQKCIIRSRFDRQIENHGAMWDFMSSQPTNYTESITVSKNKLFVGGKNKKGLKLQRQTIVEVKVAHIAFKPTQRAKNRKSREFNLVYVREINPPEGEEAVEWMLISNMPINTKDEIARIINYYRLRWLIEEYHKILKTACKIEDCCLEDSEAMFRYIILYCIIAWRIFWLVRIQRINPDVLCTEALIDSEWKALYCYLHKTQKLPDKTPTIGEVTVWIARLGGFLARKGDGEPGIISIWRGWTRLNDIVEMYTIFNSYSENEN